MDTCCKSLEWAITNCDIEISQKGTKFQIFGRPDSANEGDGYIVDMTEQLTITYCPFCGKELCPSNPQTKLPISMDYKRKGAIKVEQWTGDPDSMDRIHKLIGDGHVIETTGGNLVINSQPVNINDFVIYDQYQKIIIFSNEMFNTWKKQMF